LTQLLLGNHDDIQSAYTSALNEGVGEKHALSLVHAEMHGEDLISGPIGHGIGYEYRTGNDFVTQLIRPMQCRSHFSDCTALGSSDTTRHEVTRSVRFKSLGCMVGLLRPVCVFFFDQLNTPPLKDVKFTIVEADRHEDSPTRVSLKPKGNLHLSTFYAMRGDMQWRIID
jgi:hypothetical protein